MSTAAQTITGICRLLGVVLGIPMVVVGVTGAILTILVFARQQKFWRNRTIIYLLAGSVMTAIHLPSIYLPLTLAGSFNLRILNVTDAGFRVFMYFLNVTTVSAISYPCWAAFDQYAGSCRKTRFRNRWSSMRVVRAAVILTPVFWMIVYIPVLFMSTVPSEANLPINAVLSKIINYILIPFSYTIIPSAVIIFCTKGTINNLRSTMMANRHDRLVKQTRRMLIPQLFLLIISGLPTSMQIMYLQATNQKVKDELQLAIELIIAQMFRFFFHFNFVFTFYIYYYMSSEVRQASKRLFGKCLRRHHQITPIVMVENNQQITLQTHCSANLLKGEN